MKSLTSLWMVLAQDMGERCSVDTTRDYETVTSRTEKEGRSFLTITLPTFGKAFERWLEEGRVDLHLVPGFRRRGCLPAFLSGFTELIFSSVDGSILSNPNIDSVLAIRQLCGVFGKMFLPATPERTLAAMKGYLDVEDEVRRSAANLSPESLLGLARVFDLLFGRVCADIDACIDQYGLLPKHSNGSTADKRMGNQKWMPLVWHERLEPYFPAVDFLLPNPRYYKALDSVNFVPMELERPVKVIDVPKTQKTPRIIAMEPVCMMYTQQAILGELKPRIERDQIASRFTRFSQQEPNQVFARVGSRTGDLGTLDLSEASDRVSNDLVIHLFKKWSHLTGAIQACRSRQAVVRLGQDLVKHDLAKFASMGSALTFPIEAMVFTAIIFRGIEKDVGHELRKPDDLIEFSGQVSVYGDDLIVPTHHVRSVIHELESFGFKVNSSKSFWNGKFRESCGKDYYDGIDVSFVKFRAEWPGDRQDVEEVESLVSFFNQCKDAHYTRTTSFLREKLRKLLWGFFPRVSRTSAILGEYDDIEIDIIEMDSDTQQPLAKGWVVKPHIPENVIDDHWALLKWFLKEGEDPFDRDHLQRSGRSSSVSIILRKVLA